MLQLHPLGAVGIVMLPVDTPVHDVPVVTKNAAVLFAVMVGEVQNPLEMVGAVEEMSRLLFTSLNVVELVAPVTASPAEVANAIVAALTSNPESVVPFSLEFLPSLLNRTAFVNEGTSPVP